jgi:diadenosine tetraphosphate (Ap4A) HIT family hydrolase
MACELCSETGGELLWRNERCRVVHVTEPGYPGYCRVIWNAHVKEMTDLGEADRARCLQVVLAVEAVLRRLLAPEKVNLACLGNMTPHVHWHVIPRFKDDPHFPAPIWAAPQRAPARSATPQLHAELARELRAALHP